MNEMMDKENLKLTENEAADLANNERQILSDEELKDVAGGSITGMIVGATCDKVKTPKDCNQFPCRWVVNRCVFVG
jgi:hypothetical protein